jgi:hypothetical protein
MSCKQPDAGKSPEAQQGRRHHPLIGLSNDQEEDIDGT